MPDADNLSCSVHMDAGTLELEPITDFFSAMLKLGRTPPTIVSSEILNLFTKNEHSRMDTICEREAYYSLVYYAFRAR